MLTIIIATLAGAVTVAAPCTLPVLPILLGASVAQTSNVRPLFIALGFVTSFSVVAIAFGTITQILGVDQNTLRAIAIPILLVLMLWPTPFEWLVAHGRGLVDRSKMTRQTPGGNVSGFLLGTTLGLVWTPCAGPVLGSILTIIATSPHIKRQAFLLIAYAVGAAVPMLASCLRRPTRNHARQKCRPRLASTSARLWGAGHPVRGGDVLPIRHLNHGMGFRVLS
jgi:cytochrome c-type biogenesis protein